MSGSSPDDVIKPELGGGFSRRALVWVSVIASASLVLAVLLMVFGEDLGRKPTAQPTTFSYGLVGHRAFADYVESLGLGVLVRQTRAGIGTGPQTPLVVISPHPQWVADDETRRIPALQAEARRRGAPWIFVLPKWGTAPSEENEGWVGQMQRHSAGDVESVLAAIDDPHLSTLLVVQQAAGIERRTQTCQAQWDRTRRLEIDVAPAQLLRHTAAIEPLVDCPGGVLVGRRRIGADGPETIVIADPDILNNQGLARADHARLIELLLTDWLHADGIVIDETVHGYERQAGLLYELFRFPLVLALLQSVLLVGIVLWAGMSRFGKPLPLAAGIEAEGKEVLIDNTAKLLAYGGHSSDSLMHYFQQTVRAVAAHYFLPVDLPEAETFSRLQKIARGRNLDLDLTATRHRIQQVTSTGADERAVRIARHLYLWRRNMTRDGAGGEST